LRNIKPSRFKKLTPFDLFMAFVGEDWFKSVAAETTRNAKISRGDKFPEIIVTEMVKWHRLVISYTLWPHPNKRIHWTSGTYGPYILPNFGRYMSRSRFEDIQKFIHLRSNERRDEHPKDSSKWRLWQNWDLIERLRRTFKLYYNPGSI
jgi:hypothetical protein